MNNRELDKYLFETGSLEGALCPNCKESLVPDPEFPSHEGLKQTRYWCPKCRVGVEDGGQIVGVLVTQKDPQIGGRIGKAVELLKNTKEVLGELEADETAIPDEMIRWYEDRAKPLLDQIREQVDS